MKPPEKAKVTDVIMVLATCVMALATIAISISAGLQWRDSGKLNDAATKASDAADKFSGSAAHLEGIISSAQQNLQTMADSSTQSIQAVQDAMRLDQRAWVAEVGLAMDAPEIGKRLHGSVTWVNSGKSFAQKVKPLCHFAFVQQELTTENAFQKQVAKGFTSLGAASIGVLPPNAQAKTSLLSISPASQIDKERITGDWYTYIWGELTYDDVFHRPHTTIFCSFRQGATNDFTQCPFHNDAN